MGRVALCFLMRCKCGGVEVVLFANIGGTFPSIELKTNFDFKMFTHITTWQIELTANIYLAFK